MAEINYMRAKDIAHKYGIGLSTVWKWVSEGKLPQAYAKLSQKCTVWNAEEVEHAIQILHEKPIAEYNNLNFRDSLDKIHDSTERETQNNFKKIIKEIGVGLYKPHGEWVGLWEVRSKLSKIITEIDKEL